MNDEYLTPKQLIGVVLVNLIMWIPVLHRIYDIEQTRTDITIPQTYEASNIEVIEPDIPVLEPIVEINSDVDVPKEELVDIEEIDISSEPVETVPYSLTDEEIDLLALVTMAEAEGEPEEGKRLVIDTILNRVDSNRFPDTVYDVIYQPKAFTSMWTSRVTRCYVRDDIRQLVIEELSNRTNSEVIFFRTDYYHSYGTPLFQVGNHYFSKY